MNCPKISILLPTYNHVEYIEECVESVLNQTYTNIEFIVGDDASTDGTAEKLLKYEDRIDKIHLFDINGTGIMMSVLSADITGDYVAIINSDDVWEADKLEKQIKELETNLKAGACFTWCNLIDENGDILCKENHFNVSNRTKEQWMNYFFFHGNCMAHASALIRKDVYFKCWSPYINKFRQLPDFYEWIQMVKEYDIIMLEEKLTKIRVVNTEKRQNVSASTRNNLVRHFNEESYIWYKEIDGMNSEYFKMAFEKQLIDKDVRTEEEIMCEKLFILLRAKVEYCKIAAFFYFYDHYEEIKEILSEKYGFVSKDMHAIIATNGPGAYIQ